MRSNGFLIKETSFRQTWRLRHQGNGPRTAKGATDSATIVSHDPLPELRPHGYHRRIWHVAKSNVLKIISACTCFHIRNGLWSYSLRLSRRAGTFYNESSSSIGYNPELLIVHVVLNEVLEELDLMPGHSSLCPAFQCLDWQDSLQYRQEHDLQRHVLPISSWQKAQIRFILCMFFILSRTESASNASKISTVSVIPNSIPTIRPTHETVEP